MSKAGMSIFTVVFLTLSVSVAIVGLVAFASFVLANATAFALLGLGGLLIWKLTK